MCLFYFVIDSFDARRLLAVDSLPRGRIKPNGTIFAIEKGNQLKYFMVKIFPFIAITASFALCGCGGGDVSFRNGESYFVRNDVEQLPDFVTSEAERDSVLGMAATMSSIPTPIDFNTEVAVPVALPEANVETDIKITSLRAEGDTLVVSCAVRRGKAVSYTTRPLAIAIVSKDDIKGVKGVRIEGIE